MAKKSTKPKLELKKPEDFDVEKGRIAVEKVIRENQQWLKEMAGR